MDSWAHRSRIVLAAPGRGKGSFFAPGGLQEQPGTDFIGILEPTLGPHGAHTRPGGLQAFIFDPLGLRGEQFPLIFGFESSPASLPKHRHVLLRMNLGQEYQLWQA